MSVLVESMLAADTVTGKETSATWLQVLTELHPRYGGLSAAIPELSRALARHGIGAPIAALCRPDEQTLPPHCDADQVHWFPRSRRAWMFGGESMAALQELIGRCDGVHAHGLWTAATHAASTAARRARKPLCVTAHGMLEPWSLRQHRLRKQCYAALVEHRVLRGAACLHALTHAEAQSYRAITKDVPVAIVPNGVEVPDNISHEHFFEKYPELRGKRILLFLSRLHPKKAVDVLLAAWARVQPAHTDAHLVIAGSGDTRYEDALRAYADSHCTHGSVTFTGLLQGRVKWGALRAAECFVLPSFSEGFSVAILEALGAGTPVLATHQCNMPEIETEQCGWLTEPAMDAVGETLRRVLNQPTAINAEAGQRGQRLIQRRYTWPAVARQMADVYRWMNGATLPADVEVLP